MKNLFYLIFVILVLFSFNACQDMDIKKVEPSDILSHDRSSQLSVLDYLDLDISSISNMNIGTEDVGLIHDALLDYQWTYIKENPVIPSGHTVSSYFETMYSEFFAQYNIEVDFQIQPMFFLHDFKSIENPSDFVNGIESHSLLFNSIMGDFAGLVENISNEDAHCESFVDALNNLRILSYDLRDESEKTIVQVTIEIALHSFSYWSLNMEEYGQDAINFIANNLQKFGLENPPTVETLSARWNFKELLGADARGAWWGARVGVVAAGGPAGGVACGLAAGAAASCLNIIWQACWE